MSKQKLNLWKQLETILNSNIMTLKEKNQAITNLTTFALYKKTGNTFELNQLFQEAIWETITLTDPTIQSILIRKLQGYDQFNVLIKKHKEETKLTDIDINIELYLKVYLALLIPILSTNKTIPKNILSLFLTEIIYNVFFIGDVILINNLFKQCINQRNDTSVISSKFNRTQTVIWRIVCFLFRELIIANWLYESSTTDIQDVQHEIVPQVRSTNERKRQYPVNLLSFHYTKRNRMDYLLNFFMGSWPSLIPCEISKDSMSSHNVLSKGGSEIILKPEGRRSLELFGQIPNTFNQELYLEALNNITTVNMFEIRKGTELRETEEILYIAQQSLAENKQELKIALIEHRFFTVCKYFEYYEDQKVTVFPWFNYLVSEYNKKVKNDLKKLNKYNEFHSLEKQMTVKQLADFERLNEKYPGDKSESEHFLKLNDNKETILLLTIAFKYWKKFFTTDISTFRFIVHYFCEIMMVLRTCNGDIDTIISVLTERMASQLKTTNPYSAFLINHIKKCLYFIKHDDYCLEEIENTINVLYILSLKLTPNLLGDYKNIFKGYNMKIYPFNFIILSYLTENFQNNTDFARKFRRFQELDDYHKIASKSHSLNINIHFKERVARLFGDKPIYFKFLIAANLRLTIEGYSIHPHSGSLFRFYEQSKKKVTAEGLNQIKISLSYALGNDFNTLQEHVLWVDNNMEQVELSKYVDIPVFIYYSALKKALNNEPIGLALRADQCASALTYWGVLADCDYYKSITNLFNSNMVQKPYSIIGREYVLPVLLNQLEIWEDRMNEITNETELQSRTFLFEMLRGVLIPNAENKKLMKSVVMPHSYNLTNEGINDALIRFLKNERPSPYWDILKNDPWVDGLSKAIWHGLNRSSIKTLRLRNIINSTLKNIVKVAQSQKMKSGNYSCVIEHEDCTVKLTYKEKKKFEWSIWDDELRYSRKIKVYKQMDKIDIKGTIRSFAPVLIHSLDGGTMRFLARITKDEYNFSPHGIHDAGCCHPNDFENMIKSFKKAFHLVFFEDKYTNKEYLEKIWLIPTLNHLDEYCEKNDVKDIKKAWDNEWNDEKKNAKYDFKEVKLKSKDILNSNYNFDRET